MRDPWRDAGVQAAWYTRGMKMGSKQMPRFRRLTGRLLGLALLASLAFAATAGCASTPSAASFGPEHVEVRGETRIRGSVYR